MRGNIALHCKPCGTYEDICQLLSAGRTSNAMRRIKAIKRQSHKNDGYLLNLEGICFHRMGRIKRAVSLYRHTLRINPELWTAYYHVGIACLDLKAYKNALSWLSKAWRLYARESPERKAWVLEALGKSLYELGKFRQALEVLKRRRRYISSAKEVARNKRNLSNCWLAEAIRLSDIGRDTHPARAAELALHYDPPNRCAERFIMREQRRLVD